jgi:hypothetical protein
VLGPIHRDSAGVHITENASLGLADSLSWSVDQGPAASIGSATGADPYLFGDGTNTSLLSAIAGFVGQASGRIAVADRGSCEIRYFDFAGTFLSRVGRCGQGPGEFSHGEQAAGQPLLYRGNGDSLVMVEVPFMWMVSVLDPAGTFVARHRIGSKSPPLNIVERGYAEFSLVFGDGSYLVLNRTQGCSTERGQSGPCEARAIFQRVRMDSLVLGGFGELTSNRREVYRNEATRRTLEFDDFQSPPYWAVHGTKLYYADSRTFEIRVFRGDGALDRIVRTRTQQATPDQLPEHNRMLDAPPGSSASWRALGESAKRDWEAAWNAAARPPHLRAYDGFAVDRLGNMWVKEYVPGRQPLVGARVRPGSPWARWWVFDSTGALRYVVRLPPIPTEQSEVNPQPFEIGDNYLLFVTADSLRVESLQVYRLRKK